MVSLLERIIIPFPAFAYLYCDFFKLKKKVFFLIEVISFFFFF